MNPVDCHGHDVAGIDEMGMWVGTENAWVILGDEDTSGEGGSSDGPDHAPFGSKYFDVMGTFSDGTSFSGHYLASGEGRVRQILSGFGTFRELVITETELVSPVEITKEIFHEGIFYVDDSVLAEILGESKFR